MREFFTYAVPAVIALAFTFMLGYLIVFDPGREIPDFLSHVLTLIVGYYFGTGVTGK